MLISGWIETLSTDDDILFNDYTAEVDGSDVLGAIALSTYQQGDNGDVDGYAAGYIVRYGDRGGAHELAHDARDNAYYVFGCTFITFRLTTQFAFAYAHAATYPLGSAGIVRPAMAERHFTIRHRGTGKVLTRHRVARLPLGSRLDIEGVLDASLHDAAKHHRIEPEHLVLEEGAAPALRLPRRMRLP
jgi:hypothetical protein